MKIFYRSIKENESQLLEVEKFKTGSWLYLENPSVSDLDILVEEYGLDRDLLRDALDPFEVPRMETDKGNVYLFVRFPKKKDLTIVTFPCLVVIAKNLVVMIAGGNLGDLPSHILLGHQCFTTQKTKLSINIFSHIIEAYQGFLISIKREVRRITADISKINDGHIRDLVSSEDVLNIFLSDLEPMAKALSHLLSGKILPPFPEDSDLVEDIQLNINQLAEACRLDLKTISSIRDAYAAILAARMNRVMKLFTVLTVVLAIPTLIASIYGMNIALPFSGHPFAFALVVGSALAISSIALFFFKKQDWL